MVQIKVVRNWISYKKVSGWIFLSPPEVKLGGSKDCRVWNIIIYKNEKIDPLKDSTLPKLSIITKNGSNKSCSELNFL